MQVEGECGCSGRSYRRAQISYFFANPKGARSVAGREQRPEVFSMSPPLLHGPEEDRYQRRSGNRHQQSTPGRVVLIVALLAVWMRHIIGTWEIAPLLIMRGALPFHLARKIYPPALSMLFQIRTYRARTTFRPGTLTCAHSLSVVSAGSFSVIATAIQLRSPIPPPNDRVASRRAAATYASSRP